MNDREIVIQMAKEFRCKYTFYDRKGWRENFCGVGSIGGDFPLNKDHIGIHALCENERVVKLEFYDSKKKPMPHIIPDTIGNLAKLTELYTCAHFTELPETIKNCKLLRVLDVGCSIRKLPDSICSLTKLEELELCYSPITALPEAIGNLKKLNLLNLCGTSITKLPESIVYCVSMRKMYTYYMSLEKLPENIGKLSNLNRLWVQQTKLRKLPESIGECSKLEELHTGGVEIPESLSKCRLLKELIIGEEIELPEAIRAIPDIKIVNGWIVAVGNGTGKYEYIQRDKKTPE